MKSVTGKWSLEEKGKTVRRRKSTDDDDDDDDDDNDDGSSNDASKDTRNEITHTERKDKKMRQTKEGHTKKTKHTTQETNLIVMITEDGE